MIMIYQSQTSSVKEKTSFQQLKTIMIQFLEAELIIKCTADETTQLEVQ